MILFNRRHPSAGVTQSDGKNSAQNLFVDSRNKSSEPTNHPWLPYFVLLLKILLSKSIQLSDSKQRKNEVSLRELRKAVAKIGAGEMSLQARLKLEANERSIRAHRQHLERHWGQSLRKDSSVTNTVFSIASKGFHLLTKVGTKLNYMPYKSSPKSPQITPKCSYWVFWAFHQL